MSSPQLILVHGRAQESKDAQELKDSWIRSLKAGLRKSGSQLAIPESSIRFPYYGQYLFDRVSGRPEEQTARIVVKGPRASTQEMEFMRGVLMEVAKAQGVDTAEVLRDANQQVVERGVLNWEIVQQLLRALDKRVPSVTTATISQVAEDVYDYLFNPNVGSPIDDALRAVLAPGTSNVVVGHSLGTVVAYRALKQLKKSGGAVPLFVTLGSPLALSTIKNALRPIERPASVGQWFNARDASDVVALNALDAENFRIDPEEPPIENKSDVKNGTENRHGISGYLEDEVVASRINQALTQLTAGS